MTPDLRLLSGFARGVIIIIACPCYVSAFGFVAPIWLVTNSEFASTSELAEMKLNACVE